MSKKNLRTPKSFKLSKQTKSSTNLSLKPKTKKTDLHPEQKMHKLNTWMQWVDDNILLLLAGFLIAFIPLYPKIPLADLIPGYIVRLRLEDIFVAITAGVFAIQVLRKKVQWKTPLTWIIGGYAVAGILSTLSAVLITKTVPAEPIHIGKSLLHYFRYLEYFSLFFISYAAIKTRKHVYILLGVITATVLAISIYGFGQRYFYWPVYSTMNREFSKGLRLVLTEHARVQSTFGGHYDMSAYLVIVLPLVLAMFFTIQKKAIKAALSIPFFAGVWLLIVGASRTSFAVFFVSMSLVVGLFALQQKGWLKKIWWGVSRQIVLLVIIGAMFMRYGDSIYERFLQTLEGYPSLHNTYHTANDHRINFYRYYLEPAAVKLGLAEMKIPEAERPENSITVEELGGVMVTSDQQPRPAKLPGDVYVDIPDIVWIASEEGGVATAVERPRTYSENAERYGLSMAIRLDTLWPRAIAGFQRNPILGSGYATLTKETNIQFTEAESTDNNFLRTLGETGLFGFITFYGAMVLAMILSIRALIIDKDVMVRGLAIAYLAATVGLLLNAITIDVFASSKVAFTFWAFTGILIATLMKKLDSADSTQTTH